MRTGATKLLQVAALLCQSGIWIAGQISAEAVLYLVFIPHSMTPVFSLLTLLQCHHSLLPFYYEHQKRAVYAFNLHTLLLA